MVHLAQDSTLGYSAQWFANVLDSVEDLVLVKGDGSRLLWANRAFRDYYGMSNEELAQIVDAPHSDPDDTVQYVRDDHRVFTTGLPVTVAEPVTRKDGTVGHFETIKTAIRETPSSAITGTVGVSRAIRDRDTQAESAGRRQQRKAALEPVRVLTEEIPTAVALVDSKQRLLTCSAAFRELFDLTDPEGQPLDQLLGETLPLQDALALAIDEAQSTDRRDVKIQLRGADAWLDVHVQPWLLPLNQTGGAVITLSDVTATRANERRLQKLNAELRRTNETLEEFAFVASHDLQEPIRMVLSYSQLLVEEYGANLDGEAHTYLDFALNGAQRLQALVKDLLAFSRSGRQDMVLTETPLDEVLVGAQQDIKPLAEEVGLTVEVDGSLPRLRVDRRQMRQLMANLLSNAAKFRSADRRPHVRITAEHNDERWRVEFADNGIGLNMAYSKRIFGMFNRLHAPHEFPGTGVGLAICRRVIERHSGEIGVTSVEGQGATFWFEIPITSPDDEERKQ